MRLLTAPFDDVIIIFIFFPLRAEPVVWGGGGGGGTFGVRQHQCARSA